MREDGRFFAFRKGPFKWGKEGVKWREEASEGFRTFVGSVNRLGDWIVRSSVVVDEVRRGTRRRPGSSSGAPRGKAWRICLFEASSTAFW